MVSAGGFCAAKKGHVPRVCGELFERWLSLSPAPREDIFRSISSWFGQKLVYMSSTCDVAQQFIILSTNCLRVTGPNPMAKEPAMVVGSLVDKVVPGGLGSLQASATF